MTHEWQLKGSFCCGNLYRQRKDRRSAERLKIVLLLRTGWMAVATFQALLLDEDTVRSYRQNCVEGGTTLLLAANCNGSDPTRTLLTENFEVRSFWLHTQILVTMGIYWDLLSPSCTAIARASWPQASCFV